MAPLDDGSHLVLIALSLTFSAIPLIIYLSNTSEFRKPAALPGYQPSISVLIPARNEELGIEACVSSVLANRNVTVEVIVLDDCSTDDTAAIVGRIADTDTRVKLLRSPILPSNWAGKQYACYVLSKEAKYDILTFLDADVRLGIYALSRLASFQKTSGAELVSGFPRQEVKTFLEKLIVPMIHWLLLCYLPISRMRRSLQTGLGAGCGQWFLTTRSSYEAVGGHSSIMSSFHDGIKLPRAYRKSGFKTDFCDADSDALCRMYRSSDQVWNGFAKNAREGMAGSLQIWVWSLLLILGHLLPFALIACITHERNYSYLAIVSCLFSLFPRVNSLVRFRQPLSGVVLHPLSVLGILGIQWYSAIRYWLGAPVGWKGRANPKLENTQ